MKIDKLRTLWDEHAKAVHAFLLRLTKSEADAKDHLQDLFCRLAKQPQLFEQLEGEPRGWLLRLARNAVIDEVRRGQARERMFARINAGRPTETVDAEDPDHPLLRRALVEALAQLPEEQRVVVHARLWKHRTLDDIARELGISINTAASRYRYGLDKMRGLLRSLYEDFAPRASQPLNSKMKPNSKDPFNALGNEAPIIQPLEQRRVPSATSASFLIAALPAEDSADDAEHDFEDVVEDAPVSDEGDVIEVGEIDGEIDGEVVDGELPVTFEDALDSGDGEAGADGEILWTLSDDHVVWAYNEIFTTTVAEDGEVVEVPAEEGEVDGEGEVEGEGEIIDDPTATDGEETPEHEGEGEPEYDPVIAYSGVATGGDSAEHDSGYDGVEAVKRTLDAPADHDADAHLEVATVSFDQPIISAAPHAGEVIELGDYHAALPVLDHELSAYSEAGHVADFTMPTTALHDAPLVSTASEVAEPSFAAEHSDALAASNVDQWVPLHDASADDQLASTVEHDTLTLDHDLSHDALPPIADPLSVTPDAALHSSSLAMAAAGAALLTTDFTDRKKKQQD